ncbi:SAM-dependent chlorinase/fluorinase [Dactylosporangium sp. NPDC051485]|uniref:SAM hydrolase/SAM-dependent halogenase family protein n=1 Tax=Dactylosporangium sp. NPDC051485 TaxID=3154846 RepID=UPI003425ACCD
MAPNTISFTTDYGLADGFVAACHGAIARLAPAARVIDVTHLVPPGDVRRGAAVLAQTVPAFPPSVHLAVVDPGVGTARRPIALSTVDGSLLVGPDNGLLVPAAEALGGIATAIHLTNRAWFAASVSATFHGRDIFAPVAARLAAGAPLPEAGDPIGDPVTLPPPYVAFVDGRLESEILTVDHFGNIQLAAREVDLPAAVLVNGTPAIRATTFGDVPPGALVVFTDSAGYLAIAVNGGDAAALLAVNPGGRVVIAP